MFAEIPFAKPQYGIQQILEEQTRVTQNDNRLAKDAIILGLQNILVGGRTTIEKATTIRGDLEKIHIGKNCIISEGTVIKPSNQLANDDTKANEAKIGLKFLPMAIGDFVVIEKSCVVQAVGIGSWAYIGQSCIIQEGCVLYSCCMILPNTILARGTVVPPYMVFGGVPGRCVGRLPPSFQYEMEELCYEFLGNMFPRQQIKLGGKSSGVLKSVDRKKIGPSVPPEFRSRGNRGEMGSRSRNVSYTNNQRKVAGRPMTSGMSLGSVTEVGSPNQLRRNSHSQSKVDGRTVPTGTSQVNETESRSQKYHTRNTQGTSKSTSEIKAKPKSWFW